MALGAVLLFASCCTATVWDISKHGAVPSDKREARNNRLAINTVLQAAQPFDTILVPPSLNFYIIGGLYVTGKTQLTLEIVGNLTAVADFYGWTTENNKYSHFLEINNSTYINLQGRGLIDGSGQPWWLRYTLGDCGLNLPKNKSAYCPGRPKLVVISQSQNVLVEDLTLMNSPSFNLLLDVVKSAEVRRVVVNTDISELQKLKAQRTEFLSKTTNVNHFRGLQPEDLNTDGIDASGRDIHIHDCIVHNDDDSIAIKPQDSTGLFSTCSENMLIENMVLVGFGASIGSVPPHPNHNCVRNITFRNITMPKTGKGIYVKSNPSCDGNSTAEISNILYENVYITEPRWWSIWIGPQQQHEPGKALEDKCALDYPIQKHCPTQGCVDFRNITLRNIYVHQPLLSPGIILGNATNPMKNILFDNVVVTMSGEAGKWPYKNNYQCEYADVKITNGTSPAPICSK
eukprot:m.210786 g.210786  ORF g.210786 m.210786 type:complete len:459 (-) comp15826_c0_seq12:994-2370(-)